MTGIRQIDIGNIIHPTDVNGLVDVTQIEPISLIFTLPEAEFVPVQERLSQGPVTVFVDSQDGKQLDQGTLNLDRQPDHPDHRHDQATSPISQ